MSNENPFCQCGTSTRGLFGKEIVMTGIFKEPVEGRVKLRKLNLDGDKQADLTVYGGEDKAVYAYPKEHYEYWQREFGKTGQEKRYYTVYIKCL